MESIARFLDSKQCHPMPSLSTNLLCNNVASDEFPRYSAFAAVHTKKTEKSETQTAGAVISIGDPPAITVEATSSAKRKLVEIVEPAATENSIIAKRCKNNNDNETEQFSMRIPPSAKSELCQQRAKEQLVFQRKEIKQKKLFE